MSAKRHVTVKAKRATRGTNMLIVQMKTNTQIRKQRNDKRHIQMNMKITTKNMSREREREKQKQK